MFFFSFKKSDVLNVTLQQSVESTVLNWAAGVGKPAGKNFKNVTHQRRGRATKRDKKEAVILYPCFVNVLYVQYLIM